MQRNILINIKNKNCNIYEMTYYKVKFEIDFQCIVEEIFHKIMAGIN